MRSPVLLLALAYGVITVSAQTTDPHIHSDTAQLQNMIDGSTSPEKIRDVDAYRLFLLNVAEATDASPDEKARQLVFLTPTGLKGSDLQSAISILAVFKVSYQELVKTYNDSVEAELAGGKKADIKDFLKKRDSLVESIRQQLGSALTPESMAAFHAQVQREKKNMIVAVEDSQ